MADSAAVPSASATLPAPVSSRAALAILGSMLLLIVALTAVLVETTWGADPPTASEIPIAESVGMAPQ